MHRIIDTLLRNGVHFSIKKVTNQTEILNYDGKRLSADIQIYPAAIYIKQDQMELVDMICEGDPDFKAHFLDNKQFLHTGAMPNQIDAEMTLTITPKLKAV